MENNGKNFLRYLVNNVWEGLLDGQGHYLHRNLGDSVRNLIKDSPYGFKGNSEHVIVMLTERFLVEFEPILTRSRVVLPVQKDGIDIDGLVNELYEPNAEYWDEVVNE